MIFVVVALRLLLTFRQRGKVHSYYAMSVCLSTKLFRNDGHGIYMLKILGKFVSGVEI